MSKFFRKVRQELMKKNQISRYLLYALGEIVLVVIGILIALQINNWNEARKSRAQLNGILRTITYDLANDTTIVAAIIPYYEKHQINSQRIINKEINSSNYKECPECASLVTLIQPFTIQQKGYNLLRNFSNQQSTERDSLVTDITQFYTLFIDFIQKSNERLEADALKNLDSFKQYSWFVDLMQGRITDEMFTYFTESEDYRKRVAAHGILAHNNYLGELRAYKANAIVILERINARLQDSEQNKN